MVKTEELLWLKEQLEKDVIDDPEDLLDWLALYGLELVNEVLINRHDFDFIYVDSLNNVDDIIKTIKAGNKLLK